MLNPHTRHLRGAYRTKEHFDWSANGDGLPEMEPVETPLPLTGYRPHWGLYAGAAALAFVLTVVGVS